MVSSTLLRGVRSSSVRHRTPKEPPTQLPCHNEASITMRGKSRTRTPFRITLSRTPTTGAIDPDSHGHFYFRSRSKHRPTLLIGLDSQVRSICGRCMSCRENIYHLVPCLHTRRLTTARSLFATYILTCYLFLICPVVESCIRSFICGSFMAYWMCFPHNMVGSLRITRPKTLHDTIRIN